ncbi:ferredoxin reductase [Litoribacillus peritrichatus]|uniref:Ferredoxin reductase n=1 Tax=Litoribacillus peritrichatus TaxID=718191 RepID=A0ABP7MKB9_9GAMM
MFFTQLRSTAISTQKNTRIQPGAFMLQHLQSRAVFLGTTTSDYLAGISRRFWAQTGTLQSYLDFMLCEIDPLFSRKRIAAKVLKVTTQTSSATSFRILPASHWQGFVPGQYITLEVEVNGVRLLRNYSISSTTAEFNRSGTIDITVKAVDQGKVSNYLNKKLTAGDTLHISQAKGEFTLADHQQQPITFLAAGSGITPIMSMLESLCLQHRTAPVTLLYSVPTEKDLIFASQLQTLSQTHRFLRFIPYYSRTQGRLNQEALSDLLNLSKESATQQRVYLCGPNEFMAAQTTHLTHMGVLPANIHQESFGSANVLRTPDASSLAALNTDTPSTVHFQRSNTTITSQTNKSLLELAEQAGLKPKYGCRSGICHECKCTRTQGRLFNTLTGEWIPDEQPNVQACIAVPAGPVAIENL